MALTSAPRVASAAARRVRSRAVRVSAASVAEPLTSATDNDFSAYAPKTAFLFPGQGAQSLGMAKARPPPARAVQGWFGKLWKRACRI